MFDYKRIALGILTVSKPSITKKKKRERERERLYCSSPENIFL
jgi:hypothetical protein